MLELQEVSAGYGDTTVLQNVQLAVPDSAVVALIGPNGAGKTTLLRVAAGLTPVMAGRVLLDGEDVTDLPPEGRADRGIAHIPEGRGIFRSLSVQQNLRLLSRRVPESEALERAVHAFPVLGKRLTQNAGTLSGGEQQMLALARAYIEQPRFVLLDEVSMGLAPVVVDDIFTFLERLAGQGAGLLLVEQYVTRALELADYVFILNRGQIVFSGEPSELDQQDLFAEYIGAGH